MRRLSKRERAIGLAVAQAMAATPMIQGPNGELLDRLEDLPEPEPEPELEEPELEEPEEPDA
jgi:hypothetical protein